MLSFNALLSGKMRARASSFSDAATCYALYNLMVMIPVHFLTVPPNERASNFEKYSNFTTLLLIDLSIYLFWLW